MRYKKVRFFGCLLSLQEKWLNRMSQQLNKYITGYL